MEDTKSVKVRPSEQSGIYSSLYAEATSRRVKRLDMQKRSSDTTATILRESGIYSFLYAEAASRRVKQLDMQKRSSDTTGIGTRQTETAPICFELVQNPRTQRTLDMSTSCCSHFVKAHPAVIITFGPSRCSHPLLPSSQSPSCCHHHIRSILLLP